MSDQYLEKILRQHRAAELPSDWRPEILAKAQRATPSPLPRAALWLEAVRGVHEIFRLNPISATVLPALWLLVLLGKLGRPTSRDEEPLANLYVQRELIALQQHLALENCLEENQTAGSGMNIP